LAFYTIERRAISSSPNYFDWASLETEEIEKKIFSIPLQKIIGVRVDTAKNINFGKVLLIGFLAFGWKDKILAIDFKDDLGMRNTVFFKGRELDEFRNQIISKRYALRKKKK